MQRVFRLDPETTPPPGESRSITLGGFRVIHETLGGGRSRGVEMLTVLSGDGVIRLVPTRGMGIEDVTLGGVRFGWNSPVGGPVHPVWVPLADPGGLGWLDGFSELMVRCGLGNNGAPHHDSQGRLVWPLHGRIANLPATEITLRLDDQDRLEIGCRVEEVRMHFWKWRLDNLLLLEPGLRRVEIVDTVTNRGGAVDRFQNLYHYNIGPPVLEAGSQVVIPARRVVPRDGHSAGRVNEWDQIWGPQPGDFEHVYFIEPEFDERGCSQAMVCNASGNAGTVIRFRRDDGIRCLTLWKNLVAGADGYVIGLEPGTNWPNHREFEVSQGRCIELEPGASRTAAIGLEFAVSADDVRRLEAESRAISGGRSPVVEREPQAEVCAIQKLAWDTV